MTDAQLTHCHQALKALKDEQAASVFKSRPEEAMRHALAHLEAAIALEWQSSTRTAWVMLAPCSLEQAALHINPL